MQLHAAIVPPPDVVEAALEAAYGLVQPAAVVEEQKPGLLERVFRRHRSEPVGSPTVAMAQGTPDAVFVRLAKFGNVTGEDAAGLTEALRAAAASWPAPVLHVSRVSVAESAPFDVTAQLDGDIDALRDIYREVNEVARLQRFYLDRRSFRSVLPLGSMVAEDGSAPDGVAGAEVPHAGVRWSPVHVTLLKASSKAAGTTYAEVGQVGLADAAGELGVRAEPEASWG